MAGSEPSPEPDEPPTPHYPPHGSMNNHGGKGATNVLDGQASGINDQEREIDDFGLPVKRLPRRRSSVVESETAAVVRDLAQADKSVESASENIIPTTPQEHVGEKEEEDLRTQEASLGGDCQTLNSDGAKQTTLPRPDPSPHEEKTAEAPSHQATDELLQGNTGAVSGWSHQALAPQKPDNEVKKEEDEWQSMPSYAAYDLYDDDGHLIAREAPDSDEETNAYHGLGGAGKGYTRVQIDEDAKSATSMDDNTDYLFKPKGADVQADEDEQRDPLQQLQATKDLLTEGQRIAYVGLTRLAMAEMVKELERIPTTRSTKKVIGLALESMKMWSQKMMVRLYMHMEIDSSGKFCLSMSRS